jgi:phasin family protein
MKPKASKPVRSASSVAKSAPVAGVDLSAVPADIVKELKMNAETVIKSLEAITPAVEKVTTDAMAQGKANFETAVEKSQELMGTAVKSISEMSEFAKGNVEAVVASAKAATAGIETLSSAVVEHGKKSFEEATAAMKAMAAAKSPSELLQLQNEFSKGRFDHAVSVWSQMSETWLKVAGEITQPMSSRLAVAGEHFKGLMKAK